MFAPRLPVHAGYALALLAGTLRLMLPASATVASTGLADATVSLSVPTTVAYVNTAGRTTGKLGAAGDPFSSLAAALAAGATELRIAPGVYEEEHLAFASGGIVTLRLWNGQPGTGSTYDGDGLVEIRGTVRIDDHTTVVLAESAASFRLRGDLLLAEGTLDLRGHTLEVDAAHVVVAAGSRLLDSTYDPTAADCGGFLSYIGTDNTAVFFESLVTVLRFETVSQRVNKTGKARVSFDMSGIPPDNLAPNEPNFRDELGVPCFHVSATSADQGVDLLDGLDLLDVFEEYRQLDGEALMAGLSSPGGTQPVIQVIRTGTDFIQEDGIFRAGGSQVSANGHFLLGPEAATQPGHALFNLGHGTLTVRGDFIVGPDTDPCTGENPAAGDPCFGAATPRDDEKRNRFFLGGGRTELFGNYGFHGTGDRFGDTAFSHEAQGLDGTVFFIGPAQKQVHHRQDEDAFFNDVVMAGEGDVVLGDNTTQNDTGILLLELGIINPGEPTHTWTLLNPRFETELGDRNNAARGRGVVDLGSRDSYVNGSIGRRVAFGNATGGVVTGGYLFPVGAEGEPRDEGGTTREVDFFRPLILQFPDDLGQTSQAQVDYRQDLTAADCDFPDGGLVVDALEGGTLTLDVVGNLFWQLAFDRIPSFDPNIRVEADELPNLFDIKSLRLIQWDCDCTNPRLAGTYDLDTGEVDDASAVVNDFINGVPNLTQEGVDVAACQIIGLASSSFINRIDVPEFAEGGTPLKLINATPDFGLDAYFNDERLVADLAARQATPFGALPARSTVLNITATNDSQPLLNTTLTLGEDPVLVLVAGLPGAGTAGLFVKEDARREASAEDKVDVLAAHTFTQGADLAVTLVDLQNQATPVDLGTLGLGDFSDYHAVEPRAYHVFVSDPGTGEVLSVFSLDLSAHAEAVLTLVLTDAPPGKAEGLALLVFGDRGGLVDTPDVTAVGADAGLPEAFALRGNYPNPFNPTTTITFDLPEAAEVHIRVFDLLGRIVMTTSSEQVAAGADRTLEIHATTLASGTYFYQVIAGSPTATLTASGRMVLVR